MFSLVHRKLPTRGVARTRTLRHRPTVEALEQRTVPSTDFIYWNTDGLAPDTTTSIKRAHLDGTGVETVLDHTGRGLAIDEANGYLYSSSEGNVIFRANLDGSGRVDLLASPAGVEELELDLLHGKMYWGVGGVFPTALYRANLDGSGMEKLYSNPGGNVEGIALDPARGKLYFTDELTGIWVSDLDGSNRTSFQATAIPFDLEIDTVHGKLYWNDFAWGVASQAGIRRANLDGSGGVETVYLVPDMNNGIYFDPVYQQIYYANTNVASHGGPVTLNRISADGPGHEVVLTDLALIENIEVAHSSASPANSSLSGFVFKDFNNDGQLDFGENGLSGVTVTLTGTDDLGNPVNRSQQTDGDGAYRFQTLHPGSYYLTETQPADYLQGINSVGTAGGTVSATDQFSVALPAGVDGLNYNFGERPTTTGTVYRGQTAGIGFWNNKNGQALIKALNGVPTATQLANWLALTFPHMYGAYAGSSNLTGRSNADVAALFQQAFLQHGVKLDAQVLATALSVYVTNATLDPTSAAATYGFTVSGDGAGTAKVNVGSNGDAFGVADNTTITVLDLLPATDAQAVNGVLYNGNATLRKHANDVYSALNQAGGIG
jgi:hypothetical protein